MRLPTFYEQNLIPNWGMYACVRAYMINVMVMGFR